jgi:transposase-like protein
MGAVNESLNRTGFVGGLIPREDAHGRPRKYSPELRKRAVRMVQGHAPEYPLQWVAIRSVAEKLGCSVEALRRWVRQAEREMAGHRSGLTADERQRLSGSNAKTSNCGARTRF